MPFATACCGIELMAVGASRFDLARFGAEVMRFTPRQCDLMIIAGRIAMKMMPVLQRIWLQMPEPKWCISMGACTSTGGIFDTYAVVQGADRFMPVNVYIPGCPPRPEQILRAVMDLQAKIQKGGSLFGNNGLPELQEREKMLLEKQMLPAGLALAEERGTRPGSAIACRAGPACSAGTRPSKSVEVECDPPESFEGPDVTEAAATATESHAQSLATLARTLGEGAYSTSEFRDNFRIFLTPEQLIPALTALRDECGFCLLELGGTDYLGYPGRDPAKPRFEVHYALLNRDTHERLILKVGVNDPDPTIPSAYPLWMGADWMEREVFDMYGIKFAEHPDLRRILMPEEFAAFPLRKDYPLRGRGERHNFPGSPAANRKVGSPPFGPIASNFHRTTRRPTQVP